MNQYISEKGLWQAVISTLGSKALELYNYLLKLKSYHNVIFPSYDRLAREIGVSVRSIARYMKILKDLMLLTARKRFKKTDLMQINPMILQYAEKYSQIFPALRQFVKHRTVAIFDPFGIHNYNEVNNIIKSSINSFVSLFKFKNPLHISPAESYLQVKMCGQSTGESNKPTPEQVIVFENMLDGLITPKKTEETQKTRELVMEPSPIKISGPLKRITTALCLTKWGQIRLLIYPEQALNVVYNQMKTQNYLKAPFFWLLTELDTYCRNNKLHVDWDLLPVLKRKFNMPDKPSYLEVKLPPKPMVITPQPDKIIVSPIVGKHTAPHPHWAQFIPQDILLA